jgi:copper resistance protein D
VTVDPEAGAPAEPDQRTDTAEEGEPARNDAGSGRGAGGSSQAKYGVALGLLVCALLSAVSATAYTDVGTIPGLPELDPAVHFGLPVVRVLLDLSALATVGLSLLPKLLGFDRPEQTEPIMSVARRIAVVTALVWMSCSLLSLLLQAAEVDPGRVPTTDTVIGYVASVPAGPGLLLSAGGAFLCALLGLLAVRHGESVPAELRIIVALLGLLPMPLTGHATDWDYHDFSMISMELHVVGAAMWTGGLVAVAVFVAGRRGLLAEALPRFSKLAGIAIVTVAVSGAFNGLMELIITPGVGLAGLVTTGYGQLIVAKMACLTTLAVLGSHLRFRLLPRIARHERTAMVAWVAMEVGVMGLAYGLGAVLARAPVIT